MPSRRRWMAAERGTTADLDEIGFGDVGAGVGELLGERAVVGEEEQSFAGVVEAADGIDALGKIFEKLHDGGAAFGIGDGSDVAFGLVQKEVDKTLRRSEGAAIDADFVGEGIGLSALLGDDLAVESDAAVGDDLLGLATGSDAGSGEDFLEAFGHGKRGTPLPLGAFGRKGTRGFGVTGLRRARAGWRARAGRGTSTGERDVSRNWGVHRRRDATIWNGRA